MCFTLVTVCKRRLPYYTSLDASGYNSDTTKLYGVHVPPPSVAILYKCDQTQSYQSCPQKKTVEWCHAYTD